MKKKVTLIVLVLGLLMLCALTAPAMAKSAKIVPASTTLKSSIYYAPTEVRITPSGVAHVDGVGYVNTRTLTIGAAEYDVYVVGSFDIDQNPTTGTAIFHFIGVWYVGSLEEPTSDGFSGNIEIKILDYNSVAQTGGYTTSHSVFQGFGSFSQYTLKLDYKGPYPASDTNGYCIIP